MSTQMQQLYQQVILDHSRSRIGNADLLGDAATGAHGSSHQINPTCGDEIELETELAGDGGLTVRWSGDGCSISMASASVLSELAGDTTVADMFVIEAKFHELMHSRGTLEGEEEILGDAAAFSGVSKFPARIKCALLSWVAFKDALNQAQTSLEE
ncbi:MAG: SUF system NifU family Fe-S cluster assembly protein [Brevibacterium sp.]|uniref:Fe-S cluster assembly sulfur transfer protein SufU n=1 Tax=Brevibacterium sp. TaxID=1701 RepID=UPI002649FD8C|nr:SUF system NifU family Fe-S cluster assembly protein [Brevibacterium sp.]MDN5805586.1 SUF system NifU family Fe-S cluster assembly protein [Brevibacterium sp.]MDN5832365.1 SUF system NifU family Fe-S cluster assembly protein [Brevibacterium sp.]MDN5876061.1 SUF system NifU family Fe-S cluster assembly protein [Brevibacterium sp.]MDN5908331.1 SUF system NifU family Fe-S cluster assembly protein [Brevibacterium sp.]MDN6133682.1 SUF system NifU family Fe-S cluster assembly protein [Brevibacter